MLHAYWSVRMWFSFLPHPLSLRLIRQIPIIISDVQKSAKLKGGGGIHMPVLSESDTSAWF
jgi:hypothetical protein